MTPAPISVERLPEKWRRPPTKAGVEWIEANARRQCAYELEQALPALLQQLAELERDNATMRGTDYHQVGVEQEQEIIDLEAKLAERDAEVAFARETLAKALDVGDVSDEPLRTLAIRASNALYWRDQHRQEAERARKEATWLLRKIDGLIPGEILGTQLCEELDAFLAASGGK